MLFLQRRIMGPGWGCRSAAPSSNRMAGACGLSTTLPVERGFVLPSPLTLRHMISARKSKLIALPGASHALRYGLAFVSILVAFLVARIFLHFQLPQPFAVFALSAIAVTFWYGGTKPGIVAVLLAL